MAVVERLKQESMYGLFVHRDEKRWRCREVAVSNLPKTKSPDRTLGRTRGKLMLTPTQGKLMLTSPTRGRESDVEDAESQKPNVQGTFP